MSIMSWFMLCRYEASCSGSEWQCWWHKYVGCQ